MKSYEEFKEFYRNELLHEIQLLEQKRKTNVFRSVIVFFALLVLFIIIWLIMPSRAQEAAMTWKLLFFSFVVITGLLLNGIWKGFRKQFKERIIQKILHFINPTFQYYPDRNIGECAFDQSDIFLQKYNKFEGEDMICGKIGKTKIRCSELNVRYNNDNSTKTIFKGLFVVADFNKQFSGRTLVLPDKAEKHLGRFGKKMQEINPARSQLIKLEDIEFESKFVVYGNDQIESRYILTPNLMERILHFHKQSKSDIYLSFYQSKLYIAIPLIRDLFEPDKSKSTDFIASYTYFDDFHFILSIVDELNLNTRIWTKE